MNTRTVSLTSLLALIVVAWPSAASARGKSEVLASIKGRFPAVRQAITAGKVGETFKGTVGAPDEAAKSEAITDRGKATTIGELIAGENTDRTEYFAIAAKEQATTAEVVAKNFAAHKKTKLRSGDHWQRDDGSWVKKK